LFKFFVEKSAKFGEAKNRYLHSIHGGLFTLHVMEGVKSGNLEIYHEPNSRGSLRRRKLEIFFATFPKTWKLACNQFYQGLRDFCCFSKMKFSDGF